MPILKFVQIYKALMTERAKAKEMENWTVAAKTLERKGTFNED